MSDDLLPRSAGCAAGTLPSCRLGRRQLQAPSMGSSGESPLASSIVEGIPELLRAPAAVQSFVVLALISLSREISFKYTI